MLPLVSMGGEKVVAAHDEGVYDFNLKKGGMSHDREKIDRLAHMALEESL